MTCTVVARPAPRMIKISTITGVQSVLTRRASQELVDRVHSYGIRTVTVPVLIFGGPENRVLGRVCVPVRCDGDLFGYLWLFCDDNSLSEVELQLASDAAPRRVNFCTDYCLLTT